MRKILLLAAVSALLFVAMAHYTSPLVPSIPVLQLTFTETAFRTILDHWQAAGVARFKTHFFFDFPLLVCYGLLGYRVSTRTSLFRAFPPAAKTPIALAIPVAAAADAVENLLHLYLLYGTEPFAPVVYFAAGTVASLKWLLIAAYLGCAGYAWWKKSRRA